MNALTGWGKMVKRSSQDSCAKAMRSANGWKWSAKRGFPSIDMIIFLKSELYEFCYLQQNAFDKEDAYCPLERQIAAVPA